MSELSKIQNTFLDIVECFIRNRKYVSESEELQLEELKRLSDFHKLSAAVYETIGTAQVSLNMLDESFLRTWKKNAVWEVMSQVQRTDGFLSIYRKFIEAGVKPLVVKGIVCRNLYAKSDYRPSGDEDMLVQAEDFEIYDKIFLENGFTREDVEKDCLPHEIPYFNSRNGVYIEMHFSLFQEESKAYGELNQEFEDIYENCISENILGTEVWTLNPTQHLLYLVCHSFKHFLHGGFGIRQVCDMVLMSEYYKGQIDWHRIEKSLKRRNMYGFWSGIVRIADKYLGFEVPTKQKLNVDDNDLLIDILNGGIYGNSSIERKHSSNMTLAAVEKGQKDTVASLKGALFPDKQYMITNYPYVKKCSLLLLIAWVSRIMKRLVTVLKKPTTQQNELQIGMERVELLRKYGVIK